MSSDVAQTDPLAGATGVNVALTSRTGSRSGCARLWATEIQGVHCP
jgi:hypothetical protein